jgi:Uma2 family endonuclease
VAKRHQYVKYEDLGVPEYWIVDPQAATALILKLQVGTYREVATYSTSAQLRSLQFGTLNLTVSELFAVANAN